MGLQGFFNAFFRNSVFKKKVEETNQFANQYFTKNVAWKETDISRNNGNVSMEIAMDIV